MKRLLIGISFWISFWLGTAVTYSILAVVHAFCLVTGVSPNRTVQHSLVCWWPRMIWLPNFWWFGIHISGKENLPPKGEAVVMVANHESMFDIFVMYFLGAQFRWLSKKSVFKIPMVGGGMSWIGYVPIERGNHASHVEAMAKSADWIRRGVPMFFFPEGTRSETGELRPFKSGAFRLVKDCGVGVLPIAIRGTRNIMPKHSAWPRPASVHLTVLPKMVPAPGESVDDFASRTRAVIQSHLDRNRTEGDQVIS